MTAADARLAAARADLDMVAAAADAADAADAHLDQILTDALDRRPHTGLTSDDIAAGARMSRRNLYKRTRPTRSPEDTDGRPPPR